MDTNTQLLKAAKTGDSDTVKRLLALEGDLDCNKALQQAIKHDHEECVKLLLMQFQDAPPKTCPLQTALKHQKVHLLDLILMVLPTPDGRTFVKNVLEAAELGHHDVSEHLVRHKVYPHRTDVYRSLLIKCAEQGYDGLVSCVMTEHPQHLNENTYTRALQVSAKHGHQRCVEVLIPVSDPKQSQSQALWLAAHNQHMDCCQQLWPVSHSLLELDGSRSKLLCKTTWDFLQESEAVWQNTEIHKHIKNSHISKPVKKI